MRYFWIYLFILWLRHPFASLTFFLSLEGYGIDIFIFQYHGFDVKSMWHIALNEHVYNCSLSILEYLVLSLLNIPAGSWKCIAAMFEDAHLVNVSHWYLVHCRVRNVFSSVDPVTPVNVALFVKLQNDAYNLLRDCRLSLQRRVTAMVRPVDSWMRSNWVIEFTGFLSRLTIIHISTNPEFRTGIKFVK